MRIFRNKNIDQNSTNVKAFLLFFKERILKKKGKLALLIFIIFVGTFVTSLNPYLYGQIIDNITSSDLDSLATYLILYFWVTLLANLLSAFEVYLGQMLNFDLTRSSQSTLYNHIIRMRMKNYQSYDVGELISRINGDSSEVVSFEINIVTDSVQILVDLLVALYYVIKISTRLSTVALFYLPASFILVNKLKKYFKILTEKQKQLGDQFYSFQNETFHNNVGIKSFCLEDYVNKRFEHYINKERTLLRKRIALANIKQIAGSLITIISSLYIIYVSAILIRDNLLTIGSMVAFNSYSGRLFSAISQILGIKISLQETGVSINRINEILNTEIENNIDDKPSRCSVPQIACGNVTFCYGDSAPVLDQITIEINGPGLYCIEGDNGCGKSTLAKLFVKLYDAKSGDVYLCNQNYQGLSYRDVRTYLTYVQKEDFFLQGSILDNLRLGKMDADEQEINALCYKIGVINFFESLPNGLNTIVEEGGENLSSGEKQKLSIVRAMLRDTPIYILDEITANLDNNAEKAVMDFLKEVSKEKIIIIISHKLTTLECCDAIYKFSKGKLFMLNNKNKILFNEKKRGGSFE